MEKKKCPVCDHEIIGRTDKKFCSDQCRNEFNNKEKQYSNNYMRRVNGILKKNRRILLTLNPEGKTKVNRDRLLEKGFNFRFYTNIYQNRSGNTYYFCYEQGYLPLEGDMFALVRWNEE